MQDKAPLAASVPVRVRDRRALGWFAGSLALLGAAYVLPRGAPWLPKCWWKAWTGHACPFCGTTRAFQSMAHGEWRQALADNPLGALLFVAVVSASAWNLYRWLPRRGAAEHAP